MTRFLITIMPFLLLTVSSFSQEKHQKEHGEYPDYIRPDAKIHFIYNNIWDSIEGVYPSTHESRYSRFYSRFSGCEVIAKHQINALALEKLDVSPTDYIVLMISDTKNPEERNRSKGASGTPYKFTFYDPVSGLEWSQTLHCNNAEPAQSKYFQDIKTIKNTVQNVPEIRTGEPFKNKVIKRLLVEKTQAARKITVYYTSEDFEKNHGDSIGRYAGCSAKYLYYTNDSGETLKLENSEYYRVKIDQYDLIPLPDEGLFVTPIGYREKYFYYNAGTILEILDRSQESHVLGTASPGLVYFVSNEEFSEIYPMRDLKKDKNSSFSVIFSCTEEENKAKAEYYNAATKRNPKPVVVRSTGINVSSEQYCVEKFLSGEL